MNKRTCSIVLALGLVVSGAIAGPATAKKPKKPKACAAFQPGELGAEAETVVVTDANTAEAPLLHAFNLGPAVDEGTFDIINEEAGTPLPTTPRHYLNVQVDSKAKTAGLYVTWEFQSNQDYDLWAYNPDGTEAGASHGFQPLIATAGTAADQSNTGTNHAGESKADSENIVGLITNDCGGYTLDMANFLGQGGDFELKIWLGEGVTAPGAA